MEENILEMLKKYGINISDKYNVGIGRMPMYNHKLDVDIPLNQVRTGLHVGNGMYGFSMGNGTSKGFIPQIIGAGYDNDDPSLYFIGRASDESKSNVPVVVIDGISKLNRKLVNRPILGITSSNFKDYHLLITADGDVIIGGKSYRKTISDLETRIEQLEKLIKTSEN